MATIATIDNIQLKMYYESLLPPHLMAIEDNKVAIFNLYTLEVIDSDLSQNAEDKVIEWAGTNRLNLMKTWHKQAKHYSV